MTNRPDPTPEHPPERIDNWAEWSAAQARALHGVTVVHAPTLDALLDRYIQVTDELAGLNKYFIQRLAEVKAELAAARADATRLRAELDAANARIAALTVFVLGLTDDEREFVERLSAEIAPVTQDDCRPNSVTWNQLELLRIIARLTTHDTAHGETR